MSASKEYFLKCDSKLSRFLLTFDHLFTTKYIKYVKFFFCTLMEFADTFVIVNYVMGQE